MRAWILGTRRRRVATAAAAVGVVALGGYLLFPGRPGAMRGESVRGPAARPRAQAPDSPDLVTLDPGQREAIGLEVEPTTLGADNQVVRAHGQVVPDETKYAFITPRAAGVVRSVAAREGQHVEPGDLLALIDSPDLAQARFDLYTQSQELEIARSQAEWQEVVYKNTLALLERLEAGDSPEEIDRLFEDRPVGTNRERLISTYSARRLAKVTFDRNKELYDQKVIPARQYQQVRAEYESAEAAYQSLTEQMRYSVRLSYTQAKQNVRKAEIAERVARARLRMLGVSPDGSISEIRDGRVMGVRPDGTLAAAAAGEPAPAAPPADAAAPPAGGHAATGPAPDAAAPLQPELGDRPVSSYPVWAPFEGTVIDRMMIVPGVYVDTTHRIFTLADLSTVWIEAHVHESNYGAIVKGRDARFRFTSPAYPGETFEGEVLYAGDVVDQKTRTLRVMARAANADRRLKPGMFVEVEIVIPEGREVVMAPAAAVLTEGGRNIMFVERGPDSFERRVVTLGATAGGRVEVVDGLRPGESVATAGAFKLKARWSLAQDDAPAEAAE